MNETPVGIEWPDQKERFARLKEAVTLIGRLFREERVDFQGEFFHTHTATVYDRPDAPGPGLHRGLGAGRGPARRPHRRGLHLHVGQGRGAVHRDAHPRRPRGHREGRARPLRRRDDDRDEGQLRHRPRARDGGHEGLGGAGADGRAEDGRRGRARDGAPREGRRGRRASPLARLGRPRRARRADRARTSSGASATWSSTSPATTRSARWRSTRSTSCRGCATRFG